MKKLTRRQLLAATALAAANAEARTSTPSKNSSPADWAKAAREANSRNTEALTKFEVPMATEPAFAFKA